MGHLGLDPVTKQMIEVTKRIGHNYRKWAMKDCFIFDSLFSSNKSVESVTEVDADLIGMVKKNTKVFFKDTIENITKDWTGGYHLMLRIKPMLPGGRALMVIFYNYNAQKVIYVIVIYIKGSTQTGLLYLSMFPDQFSNVEIFPVARTLIMYMLFGSINEVDYHKNSRQYDLKLEKFWVTQCGPLHLFTAVSMGMAITNLWKLFCYGVKRYHCDKLIGIRELSEQLTIYCFSNTFKNHTRIPAKKYFHLMRSMKEIKFLLAVHFILTFLFLLTQRPALFTA